MLKGTIAKNEKGSALVIALMILVILTLIGISATTSTEIELQIARNERNQKIAFFHSDTGIYTTPKVISYCIDYDALLNNASFSYLDGDANDFYKEIMGIKSYDSDRDIEYDFDNSNINVDVNRTGAESIAGGAIEFASGAQGIGAGGGGGVGLLFDLDSLGEGPNSSTANLSAVYRKMIGIPGGL